MIVAEYIAQFLKKQNIKHVFGYAGSMMLKLADEISLTEGLTYLQTFHEQGAAFSANAYGRCTNRPGVALVTSGPGVVNALAGVADAFMDSIPFVLLAGNDRLTNMKNNPGVRLSGFQDMDVVALTKSITKYATQIKSASDIAYELEKAFYIAEDGRKGPVVIDIPMDIQFMEVPNNIKHYILPAKDFANRMIVDDINNIVPLLYTARRPAILVGGGVRTGDAVEEVELLQKCSNIPLVTTLNGFDASYNSSGFTGLYGNPVANLIVRNADILIALGTRFGNQQVGKFPNEYTSAKIIHIDVDVKELKRVFKAETGVNCEVKKFLKELLNKIDISQLNFNSWTNQIAAWHQEYDKYVYVNDDGIDPVKFVEYVSKCTEHYSSLIFTNDVGQNEMWVCQGLDIKKGQRLLSSSGYGSMGFSLPAAIGACFVTSNSKVIAFTGDGGFQMNLQELQFVNIHKLKIKCIVFNNNTLGLMRDVQRVYYNSHFLGSNTDLFQCVDIKKIAEAYDINYCKIEKEKDFIKIKDIIEDDSAWLVDCKISINSKIRTWTDFKFDYGAKIDL